MPTVDGKGPRTWDDFPLLGGRPGVTLTLDGHSIRGSVMPWSEGWAPSGVRVLMGDGTHAYQCPLPRPTQPITMDPRVGTWEITIAHQEDLIRIHRAAQRGSPVLAFFNTFHEDQWLIANGDTGQTTWRTSRRIGWNGTTRTHVTHPPYAEIDGTEQTIVTVGTPVAGEVKLPTSQTAEQFYDTVTTPALTAGTYLVVRYWPEMLVTLTINYTIEAHNAYRISVGVEEVLAGDYE